MGAADGRRVLTVTPAGSALANEDTVIIIDDNGDSAVVENAAEEGTVSEIVTGEQETTANTVKAETKAPDTAVNAVEAETEDPDTTVDAAEPATETAAETMRGGRTTNFQLFLLSL
ncbi:MAG: hypothetical protein LUG99_22630 [Lachnospiraceae bacterium]|nr:hypothetical protein [Lachnospiraceae bacterium]